MARPRIFISSTFYDLKHVRASLDLFVRSLGFDSVLSEKGDIAYSFDRPLDESCYAEVAACDVLVLIIGGRYGAAASDQAQGSSSKFLERYESITRREYETAAGLDLPVYVLVEKAVHAEYQTFRANRANPEVKYAHVDSVNVFLLLEDILSRPRNNPLFTFERFTDIENWLREQWAGLFRDLLKRASQQAQLRALAEQIAELREINETLKTYMEAVVSKVAPERSSKLISDEAQRRSRSQLLRELSSKAIVTFLAGELETSNGGILRAIDEAPDAAALAAALAALSGKEATAAKLVDMLTDDPALLGLLNDIRDRLGQPRFASVRPGDGEVRTSNDSSAG
jgi:Domain of unknown function (DUF4062)